MTEYVRLKAADKPAHGPLVGRFAREEPLVRDLPPAPDNGLAPPLVRKRLQAFIALLVADIALLLGCFYSVGFAYLIAYRGQYTMDAAMLSAYLLLPIFVTIGLFNGAYSGTALTHWPQAAWRAAQALIISAALFNFIAFFAKISDDFSRVAFALSVVSSLLIMTFLRVALVKLVARVWQNSPINRLLIYAGGPKVDIPDTYVVDAAEHGLKPILDQPEALHRLAKYLLNMDKVFVSCPESERAAWSQVLKGAGIHTEVISPIAQEIGALGIRHYGQANFSTLLISTGALRMRDRALKRAFDIAVSFVALAALSPLMLMVALAIRLEDGGPVFFRQSRVGRSNHFFAILKFRSMRCDKADAAGARSAARDDDRITRVGRFIRRTSLDELPQLFNVLLGDMSIVGPRPHALGSQAGDKLFWQIDRRYWLRHTLRPGITGLAQIRGYRGATDHEDDLSNRLQSDLEYLSDWSLWRDIAIIASTLRVLVHHKAF